MNHTWREGAPDDRGRPEAAQRFLQHATCRRCGTQRRTSFAPAGGFPIVEYLVTGVGWSRDNPGCFIPGQLALPLLEGGPQPPRPEPRPSHAVVHQCGEPVRPRYLMCRRHWFMVERSLRDAVLAAYVPGQEAGLARPTRAYVVAVHNAVAAVAALEGKSVAPLPEPKRVLRLVRGGRDGGE